MPSTVVKSSIRVGDVTLTSRKPLKVVTFALLMRVLMVGMCAACLDASILLALNRGAFQVEITSISIMGRWTFHLRVVTVL